MSSPIIGGAVVPTEVVGLVAVVVNVVVAVVAVVACVTSPSIKLLQNESLPYVSTVYLRIVRESSSRVRNTVQRSAVVFIPAV